MTTTDRTGADTAPAPALSVAERARLDKIESTPACDEDTVERVARALAEEDGEDLNYLVMRRDPKADYYRRLARAAIAALKPAPGTDSGGQMVQRVEDRRPHSRACGSRRHDHGSECHRNCPTCAGRVAGPQRDHGGEGEQ